MKLVEEREMRITDRTRRGPGSTPAAVGVERGGKRWDGPEKAIERVVRENEALDARNF